MDKSNLIKSEQEERDQWLQSVEYDIFTEMSTEEKKKLTEQEEQSISKYFMHMKSGMHSIVPVRCGGNEYCPFATACPLAMMNKAPIGTPCPTEKELLTYSTKAYVDEYHIHPVNNHSQYKLVIMLARLDVYEMRAIMQMNSIDTASLIEDTPMGMTKEGHVISVPQISQAYQLLDQIENKRLKLMRSLVGTPQEIYKRDAALNSKPEGGSKADEHSRIRKVVDELYAKIQRTNETVVVPKDGN